MYQNFSIKSEPNGEAEILHLAGYLEEVGGVALKNHIQKSLSCGTTLFGLDCSGIELISSPGIAAMLDISGDIVDNYAGIVTIWGLDKHHKATLEMSGLFFMANLVADLNEALAFMAS